MTKRISRRNFILVVATGAAGAWVVSCRPSSGDREQEGGAGDEPESPLDFSEPDPEFSQIIFNELFVTSTEHFFQTQYRGVPNVDVADWTLVIDGLVDSPLTLSYDDVLARDAVTEIRTLECIGNPPGGGLVGNAAWTGFRLRPLLDQVGVQPNAARARFYAADDYTTAIDVEWIEQDDTLMVYAMNDESLPQEHGYPLRILVPGLYGQKMPKWITRIEFIEGDYLGHWESLGWSDVAAVKTHSQIILPPRESVIRGTVILQGWAYAGRSAITAVEVRIGDGEWMPCELLQGPSPLAWTQWWVAWTPDRTGEFDVSVRATDEDGFTQQVDPRSPDASAYPDGTDAIHSVTYQVAPLEPSADD